MANVPGPVLLINPNTNAGTTELMCGIAQMALSSAGIDVRGGTAAAGPRTIAESGELKAAIPKVVAETRRQMQVGRPIQGVIIGAFGDPGLAELREELTIPVVGLGEAGVAAAATYGRFAVITTTGRIEDELSLRVRQVLDATGNDESLYAGFVSTETDATALAADPERQFDEMLIAAQKAVKECSPDALLVGGGPLGKVAQRLRPFVDVPIVEPIPEACTSLVEKLGINNQP